MVIRPITPRTRSLSNAGPKYRTVGIFLLADRVISTLVFSDQKYNY